MRNPKSDNIKKILSEKKADAFILVSRLNRFWYSNVDVNDGSFIIITQKNSFLFADARDINACKAIACVDSIVESVGYKCFIEFVSALNFKKIIIEDNITLQEYEACIKPLNIACEVYDMKQLRSIKTNEEIVLLQKSADIAVKTIEWVKKTIKAGDTEIDIAKKIHIHMLELGASDLSFSPIVAFGKNGGNPHHVCTKTKLKENDLITLDIGCKFKGYCSDITRTFWIKKPSPEHLYMYNLVKKAQAIGLKAAQVGVSGKEIDKTVRDFIEQDKKYGKLFLHGTGHGVGVEIHEYPNVNRNNNLPMKPNHVITIEPGVYKEGFGGVRIEDTIVISEKGPIILTKKSPK